MSETIPVQELAYEETIQLTEMIDFGIDLQSALSDAKAIPPEGYESTFPSKVSLRGQNSRARLPVRITFSSEVTA